MRPISSIELEGKGRPRAWTLLSSPLDPPSFTSGEFLHVQTEHDKNESEQETSEDVAASYADVDSIAGEFQPH